MQSNNGKQHNKKLRGKTRNNALRSEDHALWAAVAKTIRPLHPSKVIMPDDEAIAHFKTLLAPDEKVKTTNVSQKKRGVADSYQAKIMSAGRKTLTSPITSIDHKTQRKIANGQFEIHRQLDLHGLTQDEAYSLLLRFLKSSQFQGFRHVLIITGKGKSLQSEGILRQLVPLWLSTPTFSIYISAINNAARHHGGHGAIYLKLRKLNRL